MEARIRRRSDPMICQYLWDAITTIRNHKQLPSFDRIRRYMNRTHSMESDKVEKHLEECTADNLIVISRKVGQKGSKVGVEQEGFRLPVPPDEPESHDWYCFECHEGGDILTCSKCYRVFHLNCIASQDHVYQQDLFVCPVCQKRLFQRTGGRCRIAREELNVLLGFTIVRLKEKLPVNLMERLLTSTQKTNFVNERGNTPANARADQNTTGTVISEPFRAQLLLHHQMDLQTMEQKCQDGRYKSAYDFEIDATTIVHNTIIFHGVHSAVSDMSRQMLRDCQRDIIELEQCKDCYRYSNEKNDRFWFCKPCTPPHELVYAKQKTFPYWPAKVIKIENDSYEVRFFGSQHQRAVVEKSNVKPITINVHQLQGKRTSAWTKACEELKKHQELCDMQRHHPAFNHPIPYSYHHPQPSLPPPHPPSTPSIPQPRFFQQTPYSHFQSPQHCFPHQALIHPWDAAVQMQPRPLANLVSQPPPIHHPMSPHSSLLQPVQTSMKNDHDNEQTVKNTVDTKEVKENKKDVQSEAKADKLSVKSSEEEQGPSSSSSSKSPSKKKDLSASDDHVSSSSQDHQTITIGVQTSPRLMKLYIEESVDSKKAKENNEASIKELRDKLKREHESDKDKAVESSILKMEKEIESVRSEYKKKLKESEIRQKGQLSDAKRKQWCWSCENEAIYHCCWNTSYCTIECQQKHWKEEHKKMCRRKR